MLHERNHEAVRYFQEDQEAAFFESAEELLAKLQHYLAHPAEREAVARQGRLRCLTSGYSLDARMQQVDKFLVTAQYGMKS